MTLFVNALNGFQNFMLEKRSQTVSHPSLIQDTSIFTGTNLVAYKFRKTVRCQWNEKMTVFRILCRTVYYLLLLLEVWVLRPFLDTAISSLKLISCFLQDLNKILRRWRNSCKEAWDGGFLRRSADSWTIVPPFISPSILEVCIHSDIFPCLFLLDLLSSSAMLVSPLSILMRSQMSL